MNATVCVVMCEVRQWLADCFLCKRLISREIRGLVVADRRQKRREVRSAVQGVLFLLCPGHGAGPIHPTLVRIRGL